MKKCYQVCPSSWNLKCTLEGKVDLVLLGSILINELMNWTFICWREADTSARFPHILMNIDVKVLCLAEARSVETAACSNS